jgi:disulfide bond formation protein DsbB
MKTESIFKLEYGLNLLAFSGITALLVLAFVFQFFFSELPCPLCLLQRIGFILTGIGFLLNIRYGFRPSHYSIALLGAIFTGFVALRQVSLHILPGSGSYGTAIFGLHMYTWSFIVAVVIIASTSIMLGIDRQYLPPHPHTIRYKALAHGLFLLFLLLTIANAVADWSECGWLECPDNPTAYLHVL